MTNALITISQWLRFFLYKPEAPASESLRFSPAVDFTSPKRQRVNLFKNTQTNMSAFYLNAIQIDSLVVALGLYEEIHSLALRAC